MVRHTGHSFSRQNGLSEQPQRRESTHTYSSTGHIGYQLTNHGQIAQNVAYTHHHGLTINNYPQELEFNPPCDTHYHQYGTRPQQPSYDQVPRYSKPVNFETYAAANPLQSTYGHKGHSAPPPDSHSARAAAMKAEKRRPTSSKLEVLSYQAHPTSSMTRWEAEKQQNAPWNAVGYVPQASIYDAPRR
ncbi:hypothetical protein EJ07DRAFT_151447 [Lizonia empirigonia]|nr:hypothetical protein EJ07DRAFT_151447 [Lizonia empirigonia]